MKIKSGGLKGFNYIAAGLLSMVVAGCSEGNAANRNLESKTSYIVENINELETFLEERMAALEDVVKMEEPEVVYKESGGEVKKCKYCGVRGFFGEFKLRELRDWFKENLDYAVDCFGLGGDYCEHD